MPGRSGCSHSIAYCTYYTIHTCPHEMSLPIRFLLQFMPLRATIRSHGNLSAQAILYSCSIVPKATRHCTTSANAAHISRTEPWPKTSPSRQQQWAFSAISFRFRELLAPLQMYASRRRVLRMNRCAHSSSAERQIESRMIFEVSTGDTETHFLVRFNTAPQR